MKKIFWMAALSIVMFACSKDNDAGKDSGVPEDGVVLELAVVNSAEEGVMTKTRPLYSQEALQEVERVNVHVFQIASQGADPLYLKSYNVAGWSKGTTFKRFSLSGPDKLAAGNYQFLVVGQEATDNFHMSPLTVGVTKIGDVMASVSAPGREAEIFAGTKAVSVTSEGVRVSVEMTRQVAGILSYFKNVPAILNNTAVQYLKLIVSNADTAVYLSSGSGAMPVNAAYTIFNIDLSGQTVTSDGVYAGNDLSAQGVVKVANSQLNGKFVLPVGSITMTLGLYDAGGNPLKIWNVQDGSNTTFSITANHFYSLGQKVAKGDTTGGGTPGTDDDDAPIDLLKDQVIAITINPNWSMLHNLTIN